MCQTAVNYCGSVPCQNGGVCFPGQIPELCDFKCVCQAQYTGKTCGQLVDPCESGPCRNGAVCMATSTSDYVCVCASGFTGLNCDIQVNIFLKIYRI